MQDGVHGKDKNVSVSLRVRNKEVYVGYTIHICTRLYISLILYSILTYIPGRLLMSTMEIMDCQKILPYKE